MSGGGGSSNTTAMDGYVKASHSLLFYGWDMTGAATSLYNKEAGPFSLFRALQRAFDGEYDTNSPYYDQTTNAPVEAFDPKDAFTVSNPTSPYGRTSAAIERYALWIDEITDNIETWLDTQVNLADEGTRDEHFRGINRLAGAFSDINAVNGSAFAFSMTMAENARLQHLAKYRSDLKQGVLEMLIRGEADLVRVTDDFSKLIITAETDKQEADLEFKSKALTWDLDCFQPAGNFLASISGAATPTTFTPRRGSKVAGALGGGLSGAMAGAKVGSAIPGIGTGIGALVGGIGGLLGSM